MSLLKQGIEIEPSNQNEEQPIKEKKKRRVSELLTLVLKQFDILGKSAKSSLLVKSVTSHSTPAEIRRTQSGNDSILGLAAISKPRSCSVDNNNKIVPINGLNGLNSGKSGKTPVTGAGKLGGGENREYSTRQNWSNAAHTTALELQALAELEKEDSFFRCELFRKSPFSLRSFMILFDEVVDVIRLFLSMLTLLLLL